MASPVPGEDLAGRYHLERRLADNGLVQRWAAVDRVLARPVEIEVLSPDAGPGEHDAFAAAAAAVARLSHPSILNAYDRGLTTDGLPFLVTERAVGPTLAELEARQGAISAPRVTALGHQVALALDAAHRHGTVHGDVGAHSVQVSEDDRAKLVGFTEAGARARLAGETRTERDDVDACARMLAGALTGNAVVPAGPPFSPRSVSAGVPPSLDRVLVSAQEGGELATASELAQRLAALHLEDDARPMVDPRPTPPIGTQAVPPPTSTGGGRRGALAGIVVGLLLAAGVAVAAFVLFNQRGSPSLPTSSSTGGGGSTSPPTLAPKGAQFTIVAAQSFDPFGDRTEMQGLADNVRDGNPSTVWSTEEYATARFGSLKPGVGIAVTLDATHRLHQLALTSPSREWVFSIYIGDNVAGTLAGWGQPVASGVRVTGNVTPVDLKGTSGSAVLVWVTDLGAALAHPQRPATPYRVDIGEVQLS
jgi:serine/threonine protein kinase